MQIRLDFPTFCSFYSNSFMTTNKERGKKNELAFKHTIHGQLTRTRPIRALPVSIDMEFWTVKAYPVCNFFLPAQWIMDVFKFHGVLQDVNHLVVPEVRVRTKIIQNKSREGAVITIEHYNAKNKITQN